MKVITMRTKIYQLPRSLCIEYKLCKKKGKKKPYATVLDLSQNNVKDIL